MRLLRILTYCLFTLHPFYSPAQELPGHTWYNFTSENGLPQNSAKFIAFDRYGYCWIATEMGVVRFDGKSFRTFNRSNTPGLRSDRIIHLDLQRNKEIYFVDAATTVYSFKTGGQLIIHPDTNIVNCRREGYFSFDTLWQYPENKLLEPIFFGAAGEPFYFFPSENTGTGFFKSRYHVYVAYLKNYKTKWVAYNANFNNPMAWHNQYYVTLNPSGKMITFDTLGKTSFVQVSGIMPGKSPFPLQRFQKLFEYNGNAYAKHNNYIWQLSWQSHNSLLAKPLLDVSNLKEFNCYLYEPSLGVNVAGTDAKGLFIAKQQQFHSLKHPDAHNIYYAQAPFRDSGIITDRFIFLPHKPVYNVSRYFTFPSFSRFLITQDKQGHYWTIADRMLVETDQHLQIIKKFRPGHGQLGGIKESPSGTIWLTRNDKNKDGYVQLGRVMSDSIQWFPTYTTSGNETFLPLSDHLFWLGQWEGLQELDLSTKTLKDFPLFREANVRNIYKDRKGFIWIGTYGSGFYVWDQHRFIKLPNDRNGYLNTVHAFLEDNKGFLWITTNKGLFQAKLKDLYDHTQDTTLSLYYHYYDKSDGLPSSEFNGGGTGSAVVLKDGTFSLSTMDGIVQFHPNKIRPLLPTNKIYIDEMWVDSSCLGNLANLSLPSSFNRISIHISSPYFGNPYNQQLEYNLSGLDDKWYPVNEDNKIIFNKLSHGNYQLQLRKKGGFGVNNYVTTSLPIAIQPGFFDTWTFKILMLAGTLLLFALFVKFRTRYLVKRKNLLEQEVAVRTLTQEQLIAELQSTVNELTQSREELFYNNRFKEKLALLITHDLQSPLRFLSLLCDHLHEIAAERNDSELMQGSIELKNSSHEIHSFVEEFGLWATTQQENFQINVTRFEGASLMEELQRFFKEMMTSQGNTLIVEVDPAIKLHTDRQLLKIVLRNLLDNANKYTQNGIIHIILETKNGLGRITVRDNGNGIPLPVLQKLQTRIGQPSKSAILDKDSRLGYQVIIDFINRLEGRFTLESSPGKGTSAIISNIVCSLPIIESSAADWN